VDPLSAVLHNLRIYLLTCEPGRGIENARESISP
jgi:hypothetical protein